MIAFELVSVNYHFDEENTCHWQFYTLTSRSSPKISYITKRDFFQVYLPHSDGKI